MQSLKDNEFSPFMQLFARCSGGIATKVLVRVWSQPDRKSENLLWDKFKIKLLEKCADEESIARSVLEEKVEEALAESEEELRSLRKEAE